MGKSFLPSPMEKVCFRLLALVRWPLIGFLADFGYCGLAIDTKSLEIKMNLQLQMNKGESSLSVFFPQVVADPLWSVEIVNQLTVQRYRKPGEAFLNAMLRFAPPLLLLPKPNLTVPSSDSAVKVRSHSMYTDTNFNSANTVYSNIYQAMLVVALKFRAYVQEWSGSLRGKVTFFWSTSAFSRWLFD